MSELSRGHSTSSFVCRDTRFAKAVTSHFRVSQESQGGKNINAEQDPGVGPNYILNPT